ncbi:ribokinase [Clostridium ihumii]|uniref:ribokinase n=1 Tax=Clostridium ihumii TaxID=1470356 RepID=UPI000590693A|nr:ribokinase [Clostridium ihumii]
MKIAVVGSINADLITKTSKVPKPGETITGLEFFIGEGGKGLNQAVAASRVESDVTLFGAIGKDSNGEFLLNSMKKNKVKSDYINICENTKTGVANIVLCNGENSIIVVQGANKECTPHYVNSVKKHILECDVIIMQLEIPMDTVKEVINFAYENNKIIILNPAPALKMDKALLQKVNYIIPNEHEYKILFDTNEPIDEILKKYPKKLIITNGDKGVWYCENNEVINIKAPKVEVVDTTGAGDTFIGTFASAIAKSVSLNEAIEFGVKCSSISVTKLGAQGGMPYLKDI